MTTLIGIQEEYIATVNAAHSRWEHRKGANGRPGGHYDRIRRGAFHKAQKALLALGFTEAQARDAIHQALQMADLERNAQAE